MLAAVSCEMFAQDPASHTLTAEKRPLGKSRVAQIISYRSYKSHPANTIYYCTWCRSTKDGSRRKLRSDLSDSHCFLFATPLLDRNTCARLFCSSLPAMAAPAWTSKPQAQLHGRTCRPSAPGITGTLRPLRLRFR